MQQSNDYKQVHGRQREKVLLHAMLPNAHHRRAEAVSKSRSNTRNAGGGGKGLGEAAAAVWNTKVKIETNEQRAYFKNNLHNREI